MNPKVSIVCMIYKSKTYLDFVIDSLLMNTDDDEYDEIIILLNDATDELKEYVKQKVQKDMDYHKIKFVINDNPNKNEYYMKRVYRGWNKTVEVATGDIIVMVNSDMVFSKHWLSNMIAHVTPEKAISARLIESGKMLSGLYGLSINCGRSPREFNETKFQKLVEAVREQRLEEGGLYSPIAFYKKTFEKLGMYPNGNITLAHNTGKIEIPGDIIFWAIAKTKGILHYTSFSSVVYHIQEGEKDG